MDFSFRQISTNLCISFGTAHNHFQETGGVQARTSHNVGRAVSSDKELIVVDLLLHDPSLYLSEVCQKLREIAGIEASPATTCQIIHRNGFTLKKIKQQQSLEARRRFAAKVRFYNVQQFLWLDETGSDRRDKMREFGYKSQG